MMLYEAKTNIVKDENHDLLAGGRTTSFIY
jgi:hypothetical protein